MNHPLLVLLHKHAVGLTWSDFRILVAETMQVLFLSEQDSMRVVNVCGGTPVVSEQFSKTTGNDKIPEKLSLFPVEK